MSVTLMEILHPVWIEYHVLHYGTIINYCSRGSVNRARYVENENFRIKIKTRPIWDTHIFHHTFALSRYPERNLQ